MKNTAFLRTNIISLLFVLSFTLQAKEAQKVSTAQAKELLFYPQQNATAVAKPLNHCKVPTQISAQVVSIPVQRGDLVSEGQLLVKLDCQDKELALVHARSQWSIAKAQLTLSQRNLKRAISLRKNINIGKAELDRSQVDVDVAELKVLELNTNMMSQKLAVQRCDITSPFDGIVTKRLASVGDYVAIGQALLSVVEQNNIDIQAQVPLSQLTNLVNGTQYQFISNGQTVDIKLKNIVKFIEANSQSQIVSFSVPSNTVIAGAEGMVNWRTQGPYFPAHLLTQRKEQYGIFIVAQDKAKFIVVENAQEGRPFHLSVDDNSQIIIDGRHRISNDDLVTFVTE